MMKGRKEFVGRPIHRLPGVIPAGKVFSSPRKLAPYWSVGFVVLGVIVGGYWFVFQSEVFRVTSVEVVGIESSAVVAVTGRFVGENIFRLNSAAVGQDLRQAYPAIAEVTIIRGLPRTVRLSVSLREPKVRWQRGGTVFIVDATGQIFAAGEQPEHANLPKIVDLSSAPVAAGQMIVTPVFITFVEKLQNQLSDFGRDHIANEITETTYHLDVVLSGDLRLRLTTQRPLDEQLAAARSIFASHPEARVIDVRVPRWGYWK